MVYDDGNAQAITNYGRVHTKTNMVKISARYLEPHVKTIADVSAEPRSHVAFPVQGGNSPLFYQQSLTIADDGVHFLADVVVRYHVIEQTQSLLDICSRACIGNQISFIQECRFSCSG